MDFIDNELLGELVRWLSKSGELIYKEELRKLAQTWNDSQKISLYEFPRNNGQRFESEWRSQFVEVIEIPEELLPGRKDAEVEEWGHKIFVLIDEGDLCRLQAFIESTGQVAQQFDPEKAYSEGNSCNRDKAEVVPFEFYPLEVANEDGDYPEPYARKRGRVEIADFLKASIGDLSARWRAAYEEGYRREMARRRTFQIEVHEDLSLSHKGEPRTLEELLATALAENANFLVMQIRRESDASPAAVWAPIHAAFYNAGIRGFENIWIG